MPFDFRVSPAADRSESARLRVRLALAGWRPRPIARPARRHPLAALRAALQLLRRPLSDRQPRLC